MLFNSLEFVIFFPLVFIAYYSIPHKFRWLLLLVASYYFYMCWRVEYILLIVASTVVDYYAAIGMYKSKKKSVRKKFLLLSLIVNLGLLFGFKYFNFLNDSFRAAFDYYNIFYDVPAFKILLPVGISFYTFQTLSYSIDVYRGRTKPEKHFGRFALYVSFFPQLVAGPIERSTRLLPQFSKVVAFNNSQVVSGLRLALWGFVKKLVIADRLGVYVGDIFTNPGEYQGLHVLIASVFLHIQVYADLSGYTDIARGTARALGFDLIKNFNLPLFSTSFHDFWKRWHISLTQWFTDYLYIPLGGSRVVKWRWYYNIFIVFLISGLWHGANWTFVIWGALHGIYQLLEIWTNSLRHKFFRIIGLFKVPGLFRLLSILTVLLLVSFATLFFGAKNLSDSMILINSAFSEFSLNSFAHDFTKSLNLQLSFAVVIFLFSIEFLHSKFNLIHYIKQKPQFLRWIIYLTMIFIIFNFGVFGEKEFIYFEF